MNRQIADINRRNVKNDRSFKIERKYSEFLVPNNTLLKYIPKAILFNSQDIIKEISICAWRSKTYLPIIKIIQYVINIIDPPDEPKQILNIQVSSVINANKIKQNNENEERALSFIQEHGDKGRYEMIIKVEQIKCTLKDLGKLPLSQIIHLIKELLIGFQVLIDIFDFFEPSEEMVVVNTYCQWKMWISEDYFINYQPAEHINERQFIKKLLQMAENHCIVSNQTKVLFKMFQDMEQTNQYSFIKILEKINQFVLIHKILQINKAIVPNCIKETPKNHNNPNCTINIPNPSTIIPYQIKHKPINSSPIKISSKDVSRMTNKSFSNLPYQTHTNKQIKHNSYHEIVRTGNKNHKENHNKILQTPFKEISSGFKYIPKLQNKIYSMNDTQSFSNHEANKFIGKRSSITANIRPLTPTKLTQKDFSQPKKALFLSPQSKSSTQKKVASSFFNSQTIQRSKSIKKLKERKFSHDQQNLDSTLKLQKLQRKSQFYPGLKFPDMGRQEESQKNSNSKFISPPKMLFPFEQQNVSTPNNSSSTKQIQISSQCECNYSNLKKNDLGYNSREKQNHSFVNSLFYKNTDDFKARNMSGSYQFSNKKDFEGETKKPLLTHNKIELLEGNNMFELFGDNFQMKNIDGSLIIDKYEQPFEKAHLKDIKLDLLDNFGRNVNEIVEEDDQQIDQHKRNKEVMQLIQEEIDEGKSFFEQCRNNKSIEIEQSILNQQQLKNKAKLCDFQQKSSLLELYFERYEFGSQKSKVPLFKSIKKNNFDIL